MSRFEKIDVKSSKRASTGGVEDERVVDVFDGLMGNLLLRQPDSCNESHHVTCDVGGSFTKSVGDDKGCRENSSQDAQIRVKAVF